MSLLYTVLNIVWSGPEWASLLEVCIIHFVGIFFHCSPFSLYYMFAVYVTIKHGKQYSPGASWQNLNMWINNVKSVYFNLVHQLCEARCETCLKDV